MRDQVERIRQVYQEYDNNFDIQARRAAGNPGNQIIMVERAQAIYDFLHIYNIMPLHERQVLDIGCGRGNLLAMFKDLGALPQDLYGIDLLPDRIKDARRIYPDIRFTCGNAEYLNFPDAFFDLVVLFTVFSSILDNDMAQNVADEVRRVLKHGGAVLWYDFRYNNPWNPNTQGMTKQLIRRHFPCFDMDFRSITLIPPFARRLGRLTRVLYPLLASIPPLRTHYLGLFTKASTSGL